jgi:hypothetical protein
MRVNSANILDEGLMIGGRGRRMNSKVKFSQRRRGLACVENKRGTQLAQSQSIHGQPLLAPIYMCDWRCLATQLGTPRGRYDEHCGKFPLVWNQGLIEPVGERNHFRRLMLDGLAMLQTICLWRLSRWNSAPAATWNLHTAQPKYFAPTSSEVVNLTGLL